MSVLEESEVTQCSSEVHLRKAFIVSLPTPSDDRLDALRTQYSFTRLTFDSDHDLVGREGKTLDNGRVVSIREVGLLTSTDRAAVVCLGTTTERALELLEHVVGAAFGVTSDTFRKAIEYIGYNTTTKVQFSAPLAGLFARPIQELFDRWSRMDSHAVVAPLALETWPPATSAMVHAEPSYLRKYFGGDAPQTVLVVPADLDFFLYLPSRYYRMTKHRVRITAETVEDFLENRYFVHTGLPYRAHMELVQTIDAVVSSKAG